MKHDNEHEHVGELPVPPAKPAVEVTLPDTYEEPAIGGDIPCGEGLRVVLGDSSQRAMARMANHHKLHRVRAGMVVNGIRVIPDESLYRKDTDGLLWYGNLPLWVETVGHYQARMRAEAEKRRRILGNHAQNTRRKISTAGMRVVDLEGTDPPKG